MTIGCVDLFYQNRYSGTDKQLHKKDFVKAAEADGFGFARRVTQREDLKSALEAFLAFEGPSFIEIVVDLSEHVYPMVGPGMGYTDMITGEHIKPRDKKDVTVDKNAGF